jgi:hypothetical protein
MDRPNDSRGRIGRFFGGLVKGAKKILGLGEPEFQPTTHTFEVAPGVPAEKFRITQPLSRRDRQRTLDVFAVKQKLGRSFFTRRLTPASRRARLRTLKSNELEIARAEGWVL